MDYLKIVAAESAFRLKLRQNYSSLGIGLAIQMPLWKILHMTVIIRSHHLRLTIIHVIVYLGIYWYANILNLGLIKRKIQIRCVCRVNLSRIIEIAIRIVVKN
jgi:hypothetical protein